MAFYANSSLSGRPAYQFCDCTGYTYGILRSHIGDVAKAWCDLEEKRRKEAERTAMCAGLGIPNISHVDEWWNQIKRQYASLPSIDVSSVWPELGSSYKEVTDADFNAMLEEIK